MATSTTPRTMPKLLKATYLADQEALLDETRATALFYFPGVVFWLLVFGAFAYLSAAAVYGWVGWGTYTNALSTLAGWVHVAAHTFETYVLYVFLLLVIINLIRFLIRYLHWISTVYAVTSRRVIVQKGILGRDFDEIPVLQVRGVDVQQSFGQRILGYGSLRVSSEGGFTLGNEYWHGIPRPFRFQKLIENATVGAQAPSGPGSMTVPARR
jgi:membrane protein YdbS with pleckstrin-like domain